MRAQQLVACLTNKERAQIATQLEQHKRHSLTPLFKTICIAVEAQRPVTKDEMFKACFAEEYQQNKDYLMRNELRLLAKYVQDYILRTELQRECEQNPYFESEWLQAAFLRRQNPELFKKQQIKFSKQARRQSNWDYLAATTRQYSQHLTKDHDSGNLETVNELRNVCGENIAMLKRQFVRNLREAELGKLRANRFYYHRTGVKVGQTLQETLDLCSDECNDDYSYATYYNAYYNYCTDKSDTSLLARSYAHLSRASVFGKNHVNQKMILLNELGLACLFHNHVSAANRYFNILQELGTTNNQTIQPEFASARIACFASMRKYADLIEYYDSLDAKSRAARVSYAHSLTVSLCLLLQGNLERPKQIIQSLPKHHNDQYACVRRLIEVALDVQSKQLEAAERKHENLLEFLRTHSKSNDILQWYYSCSKILGRIITLMQAPPDQHKWQLVLKSIVDAPLPPPPLRPGFRLPFDWIVWQFEQQSGLQHPDWDWNAPRIDIPLQTVPLVDKVPE